MESVIRPFWNWVLDRLFGPAEDFDYTSTTSDVSVDGRPRVYRDGEAICFDCDQPKSARGVPAICAAWHLPPDEDDTGFCPGGRV